MPNDKVRVALDKLSDEQIGVLLSYLDSFAETIQDTVDGSTLPYSYYLEAIEQELGTDARILYSIWEAVHE